MSISVSPLRTRIAQVVIICWRPRWRQTVIVAVMDAIAEWHLDMSPSPAACATLTFASNVEKYRHQTWWKRWSLPWRDCFNMASLRVELCEHTWQLFHHLGIWASSRAALDIEKEVVLEMLQLLMSKVVFHWQEPSRIASMCRKPFELEAPSCRIRPSWVRPSHEVNLKTSRKKKLCWRGSAKPQFWDLFAFNWW